jgi:hypothetical protein
MTNRRALYDEAGGLSVVVLLIGSLSSWALKGGSQSIAPQSSAPRASTAAATSAPPVTIDSSIGIVGRGTLSSPFRRRPICRTEPPDDGVLGIQRARRRAVCKANRQGRGERGQHYIPPKHMMMLGVHRKLGHA